MGVGGGGVTTRGGGIGSGAGGAGDGTGTGEGDGGAVGGTAAAVPGAPVTLSWMFVGYFPTADCVIAPLQLK